MMCRTTGVEVPRCAIENDIFTASHGSKFVRKKLESIQAQHYFGHEANAAIKHIKSRVTEEKLRKMTSKSNLR